MTQRTMRPIVTLISVVALLTACAGHTPPMPASVSVSFTSQLQTVSNSIVAASGYAKEFVDVTANPARLRIEIADQALAKADRIARETKASDMVNAAERAMASQPELRGVQAVSVAVIHESDARGWHVEDVVEFRKGPNGRFSIHGPS